MYRFFKNSAQYRLQSSSPIVSRIHGPVSHPHLKIILDFVSPEQASVLVSESDIKLKRMYGRRGYEESHFDKVITGYKESEASDWGGVSGSKVVNQVIDSMKSQIRSFLGDQSGSLEFHHPHILDLRSSNSGINSHIDSVTASGRVIGALCLLSPSVMIFKEKLSQKESFRVLLPARCFYIQSDDLRFDYTHEIPMSGDPNHSIGGVFVDRGRRLSIMLRDRPKREK